MLKVMTSLTTAAFALVGAAHAATLNATDITGLRSGPVTGGSVLLLGFQAVKNGTEDRTIAHFDISDLSGPVASAKLLAPISNLDTGGAGGTFDIYSFEGDGTVSIDEWDAGTLLADFTGLDASFETLEVDLTALLNSAIAAGDIYLSFNYRAGTGSDRYFLGSVVGLADSTIEFEAIPLPAGAWLFLSALGAGGLLRKRADGLS